ncbi:1-phosphofructokinase family hexose kinase [Limobrevibacterium gyesilva]|uniref:Phosphofructokinase n=1 Tax=Limobrevibacterium gyesilva TaxID=2991712 RepID=A0AA42CIZ3_9PROT|nr:hexose kinase [Limobrevibacterium gyesilva]MCW3476432.1 hexose kinase [Limobrevibacterium gyesilva]
MGPRIVTLTLNPAVDVACDAEAVRPVHKVRTFAETHDPGGGGVNVARVIRELGGDVLAVVLTGGVTGRFLEELLEEGGVPCHVVPIAGRTRIAMTVHDRSARQEYRFVPEGPVASAAELEAALAALAAEPGGWLVASGSLPRGAPVDFYATVARLAAERGQHVVLDTSGPALQAALGHGLALIKPSLGEFEALVGRKLPDAAAQDAAAMAVVRSGGAARVAVSLGGGGALLATPEGLWRRPALDVPARSTVGAGDSFLAAMTLALARGSDPADALAWGIAAGAAAVMQTGTAHPRRADVESLYQRACNV